MFEESIAEKPEKSFPILRPTPNTEDPDYLYRRAEQELELAQAATIPAVVKAHYLLADHYLEALHAQEVETV